jgi:hypothetical protein
MWPAIRGRTPDGAAGTVEHGEETVAGRVNLASTETGQFATHEGVMALEKLPPRSITVLSRKAGRPDDVGEQDRGQDPVGFSQRRHIPLAVDVAEPLGQQHDVHRSVADQLVRDVQAVVPRVPRLGKRHRHSLAAES